MNKFKLVMILCLSALAGVSWAQEDWDRKFEQLGSELPTPNSYRTGSGAPGENYWQQRADYKISVAIDDDTQVLTGSETITYYNNSPHVLDYLWVQLDQNVRAEDNLATQTRSTTIRDSTVTKFFASSMGAMDYEGGFKISSVKDESGNDLSHMIHRTMMRVDLPSPMKTGDTFTFSIDWSYNIYDRMMIDGRGGYEYFPEDGNYAYTCAQWYPRMAVYDDYEGWQNKQFIGRGEFALTFGNFEVDITVPDDHIVAATGMLQNPKDVLSKDQFRRLEEAKTTFDKPVFIVTEKEARDNEKKKSSRTSTWKFKAEMVRDFAFASSRKYIWDAQAVKLSNSTPLAMSFYPKEGNPLWEKESTKAIKNTLEVYSERTFDYPYPVAISVNAANQGMEYPMICFNYGRPDENGNYSDRVRDGNISVIVHEVGHNYFPMIVNSDERQWTWMDEGLNTFLEKETKRERYPDLDLVWGTPRGVINYMKGDKNYIRPIMTNSEQVMQFGYNAYGKPAAALTVLREVVMGPELFDAAFKEYANRWKFKHPKPADFFRTMEDASAVDLDWFWRGWFYSVDHVDVSVDEVTWYRMRSDQEDIENRQRNVEASGPMSGNSEGSSLDAPKLFSLTETNERFYGEFMNRVDDNAIMGKLADKNFYEVKFSNQGGLVTPLLIEFTFKDGSSKVEKIPAEIWRMNESEVTKVFYFDKEVTSIQLDPQQLTGDTNVKDNAFPRTDMESRFESFRASADENAEVDITGDWSYVASMPQGDIQGDLEIRGSDGAYTGTLATDNGSYDLRDITVSGNVFRFMFDVESNGQDLVFESDVIVEEGMYKGKLNVMASGSSNPLASFDLYGLKK